jgi:hypothetical protein
MFNQLTASGPGGADRSRALRKDIDAPLELSVDFTIAR